VGLSYGGFPALNYALAAPTRVTKLVLASPAAGFIGLPKSLYVRVLLFFLLPGRSGPERVLDFVFADRFPLDHPLIQQLRVGAKTLNPQVYRVLPKAFTDTELSTLAVPVHLLLGEKEVCYNPSSAAKRARRLLPNASVEIFPNLGHALVLERPDIVNPRLSHFLLHP
jgi:pimeloyl-ACP methyl ester carboxylesterase